MGVKAHLVALIEMDPFSAQPWSGIPYAQELGPQETRDELPVVFLSDRGVPLFTPWLIGPPRNLPRSLVDTGWFVARSGCVLRVGRHWRR